MSEEKNNRIRIGGLWARKNEYGTYHTGKISKQDIENAEVDEQGNISILIYKAKEQKTDKSPTHNIFAFTGQAQSAPKSTKAPAKKPAPAVVEDDEDPI
jgi:hypothetical protein